MSESTSESGDSLEQAPDDPSNIDQNQMIGNLSDEEIRANLLADQLAEVRRQLEETRSKLETMRQHALIDSLTDVGNRRAMDETLERRFGELVRYDHSFSMLVIDLDRLKTINDTHGHSAGDTVIKAIARRLCELLRQSDVVFRIGGDEFIVLLPGTDGASAKITADRLCRDVAELKIPLGSVNLQTTISVGVSQAGKEDDARTLYDRADKLLYSAKAAGGNCSAFDAGEIEQIPE